LLFIGIKTIVTTVIDKDTIADILSEEGDSMEINISKIISANDLDLNVPKIIRKLQEQDELIVFENNKPQFVIMALEKAAKKKSWFPIHRSEASKSVRIGKYVQDKNRELFYSDTLSLEDINNLTDKQYAKDIFNLNFSGFTGN
jgi:carbamate kinase